MYFLTLLQFHVAIYLDWFYRSIKVGRPIFDLELWPRVISRPIWKHQGRQQVMGHCYDNHCTTDRFYWRLLSFKKNSEMRWDYWRTTFAMFILVHNSQCHFSFS